MISSNNLSPKNILKRGYSITLDDDGKSITNSASLKAGSKIKTIYADGSTISTVEEVKGE